MPKYSVEFKKEVVEYYLAGNGNLQNFPEILRRSK